MEEREKVRQAKQSLNTVFMGNYVSQIRLRRTSQTPETVIRHLLENRRIKIENKVMFFVIFTVSEMLPN